MSRSILIMRNASGKSSTENKTHIASSKTFSENRAVYETMWKKYCRARQATDDNKEGAHCMLDT